MVEIICVDCSEKRSVGENCSFIVKRCIKCQKEFRKKCRAKNRPRWNSTYTERSPETRIKRRKHNLIWHWTRKSKVINKYGGFCVFCKTKELAILTIDHINDDGAKERESEKHSNTFYRQLLNYPKRDDLQVLCISCQWRKQLYGPDMSKWTPAGAFHLLNEIRVFSLAEYGEKVS